MRKTALLLAWMASTLFMASFDKAARAPVGPSLKNIALVVFLCLVISSAGSTSFREAEAAPKPNVLFVLTDDQDPESLRRMANVQARLVDKGTSFSTAIATTPQCCPSRVSFMRGQYVHNHGVLQNKEPQGGYERFRKLGLQQSTIATWLNDAGYATFYAGKFLNGYEDTRYVPPGWDRWFAFSGGVHKRDYRVNENGTLRTYSQDQQHETYYLQERAETFIRHHARGDAPWFAWVNTHASHVPHTIAPEFVHSYDDAKMPTPPSYNEADVSDKPPWIRQRPRVDSDCSTHEPDYDCHRQVVEEWRARQEILRSVDVMVNDLIKALVETNQMSRTYVVFASDNGYLLYRHRVYEKGAPYEESQGVPFVVRGPGVERGVVNHKLVANIDLAPTIAQWTGVQTPKYVDGRSLVPVLKGTSKSWRQRLLLEFLTLHAYVGVRTARGETYVEYRSGEKEYYDLAVDPWQLRSAHRKPTNAQRLSELSSVLSDLKGCARSRCREVENAP